ncbi:hypothetical protein ACLBYG_18875 [Methylobacterium sp. D53M]|jgi:hypothetical protein
MAQMNVQSIRRMVAQIRADHEIQEILARNAFMVADTETMILDLNSRSQDCRHRVAFQWCEAHAISPWRRRIRERSGNAVLDRIIFEFEDPADAAALRDWLAARGW